MNKNFFFSICILLHCLFIISCDTVNLSNQVVVSMVEPSQNYSPIVHHKGQENAICRAGLPDKYYLPWDKNIPGGTGGAAGGTGTAAGGTGTAAKDRIYIPTVQDYWLKVHPLIHNTTNYYLVVTNLDFEVSVGGARSGGNNAQPQPFSFSTSYCETSPLYILPGGQDIKNAILSTHVDQRFVPGNLVFYLDNLPIKKNNTSNTTSNIQRIDRIPRYSVRWKMVGYFANVAGERAGSFQKLGRFTTRSESF